MEETQKKRTPFKVFYYRGVVLDDLLAKSTEEIFAMYPARQRRKFSRGLDESTQQFLKKLVAARKGLAQGEKPAPVKTHCRNYVIVPEMIGSIVGIYNGKAFINVEIKPEMIGHYLGEFAMTYKPCLHGKAGMKGMKMIPF